MDRPVLSEAERDKVKRWYLAAQQGDRIRRRSERGRPGDSQQNAEVAGLLVEQAFELHGPEVLVDDEKAIEAEAALARAVSRLQSPASRRKSA